MQRAAGLSYAVESCPGAHRHCAMHSPTSFKSQQGQPLTFVFSLGEIQDPWLTAVTMIGPGRNRREIQIKLAAQMFLRALIGNNSVPFCKNEGDGDGSAQLFSTVTVFWGK